MKHIYSHNFLVVNVLVFLLIFISCSNTSPKKEDIIIWNKTRLLNWNDFKGKPEDRVAAASTTYAIVKFISKNSKSEATIRIEAVFFCTKSWKKNHLVNKTILEHEQKHFDISELFARKFRKRISETKYKSFEDLDSKSDLFKEGIEKAMELYQKEYDLKTEGSTNADAQSKWNKKINSEIENLNAFSTTSYSISL